MLQFCIDVHRNHQVKETDVEVIADAMKRHGYKQFLNKRVPLLSGLLPKATADCACWLVSSSTLDWPFANRNSVSCNDSTSGVGACCGGLLGVALLAAAMMLSPPCQLGCVWSCKTASMVFYSQHRDPWRLAASEAPDLEFNNTIYYQHTHIYLQLCLSK